MVLQIPAALLQGRSSHLWPQFEKHGRRTFVGGCWAGRRHARPCQGRFIGLHHHAVAVGLGRVPAGRGQARDSWGPLLPRAPTGLLDCMIEGSLQQLGEALLMCTLGTRKAYARHTEINKQLHICSSALGSSRALAHKGCRQSQLSPLPQESHMPDASQRATPTHWTCQQACPPAD